MVVIASAAATANRKRLEDTKQQEQPRVRDKDNNVRYYAEKALNMQGTSDRVQTTPFNNNVTQKITSADTSTSRVNKIYTQFEFPDGSVILDYGGGKYDHNINYMATKGCRVLVYDPFNRDQAHNDAVINYVKQNGVNYVVCSNVLNVLESTEIIKDVLTKISYLVQVSEAKPQISNCPALFVIYEKNKDGKSEVTNKGFQRNQPYTWYIPFLKKFFANVEHKNGIINCSLKPLS